MAVHVPIGLVRSWTSLSSNCWAERSLLQSEVWRSRLDGRVDWGFRKPPPPPESSPPASLASRPSARLDHDSAVMSVDRFEVPLLAKGFMGYYNYLYSLGW